ncbi:hypothetical protein NMY22_g7320 [Coprinellus aureogranulatus]|nr:hypothetical protein NMY22_g7320 [Coprinellus aureogranulatus]
MSSSFTSAIRANDLNGLVGLVKANPTRETIGEILEAYEAVATGDPPNADAYHTTLFALQNSPDVPEVVAAGDDGSETKEAFNRVFNRSLFNTIGSLLNEESNTDITSANKHLIASLLSGSAIKTKACFSSDQVGAITVGLHFKDSDYTSYIKPDQNEVKAVGALIQVLAAAKRILEIEWLGQSDLTEGVQNIGDVISSTSGKKVHEVSVASWSKRNPGLTHGFVQAALALAQSGFKDAWDSKDIWALLA